MGKSITEIKLQPSAALETVIGKGKVTRPQAVKKVWAYIKAKKLQDKKNKRMINCDEKLAKVCAGKKKVSMFDLAKLLSKNLK
ncbi:MAG: SWIB/MDM2 domain-containing protein [Mycoplasmoidaceae bacterium]